MSYYGLESKRGTQKFHCPASASIPVEWIRSTSWSVYELKSAPPDRVLGDLMLNMVGFDAFSQALTNSLLAKEIFMRQTFNDIGWETIENTSSFQEIVNRNIGARSLGDDVGASFTYTTP